VDGFVMAVDRGRYTCVVGPHVVVAVQARQLGRHSVVVGDQVGLVGDVSGRADTLARIVRIADRSSVLTRTADDDDTSSEARVERVVVANADQVVIVSALADPPPRTGFIDRCLVAAYDAGIDPLLCLTKADLAGPDDVLRYYAELDLRAVLCSPDDPLTDLRSALAGRVSVLIGHSGVGKSTLVNRLIPDAARTVGVVSAGGRGRHTSTSVVAIPLTDQESTVEPVGWIIDTPGIRSFGLAHVSADSLLHGFPDLVEASTQCPPNCDHTGAVRGDQAQSAAPRPRIDPTRTDPTRPDPNRPDLARSDLARSDPAAQGPVGRVSRVCGLDRLVAAGGADPRRLASYRRLLASRAGEPAPDQPGQPQR
jgi:ribosome biogenesis GTPase / thiamine phosphate phosphatase